jgi:hypothetical protein
MRRPITKTADTILVFLQAYRRARMRMIFIPFTVAIVFNIAVEIFEIPRDQMPGYIAIPIGLIVSWYLASGLFSFLGGKARCPQCKTMPLVFSKLLGVGPVVRFGIPIFERQIKRCHKCDYPLSLAELEKDLAAERQALEQSEAKAESKA